MPSPAASCNVWAWRLPVIALLLYCLGSGAAQAANDRGFFWRVSSPTTVVYLLGSIHFADSSFYPLRELVEKNFQQADVLVVELDITGIDPRQYSEYISRLGYYPPGDSLKQHISKQSWRRLQTFLQAFDIAPETVARKKPGLLIMDLTAVMLARLGYQVGEGIDLHFILQAKRQGKPVIGLETLQQQLALFIDMPAAETLLQASLDDAEQAETQLQQLEQAWKSGDEQALQQLMITRPEARYEDYRQINEVLLYRRNDAMAAKIRTMLAGDKRYFVVVGAGHLVGERGIVHQLKQADYTVERL